MKLQLFFGDRIPQREPRKTSIINTKPETPRGVQSQLQRHRTVKQKHRQKQKLKQREAVGRVAFIRDACQHSERR